MRDGDRRQLPTPRSDVVTFRADAYDARPDARRSAPSLAPPPPPPVSPPRLPTALVVDHDAGARAALAHMLYLFGHVAVGAADGDEALALAARYAASLTLLVADVDVPGGAAPVLAQAVVSRLPGLPVLFVSGERAPRDLSDAVVGQPAAFLAKPLTVDALKRALAELTS